MTQFTTQEPNHSYDDVTDLHPSEIWEKKSQLVVIDVRRPDEFNGELGHVPGAQNIVLDTLPTQLDQIPKDKPVVFYCVSGGRSGRACSFAVSHGFSNVFNMKGGMQLWHQLGFDVEGKSDY
jgi:hydroxyacylglutathione hydrolase